MKFKGTKYSAIGLLSLSLLLSFFAGRSFLEMRNPKPIFAGPDVKEVKHLSDYAPVLAGTPEDPRVYVMEGEQKGGTVFILGGTHPNEPAGFLSAVTIVENATLERGRLIVIPRANPSGFTHTQPLEGSPQFFSVKTPKGTRSFRFGSRRTNPIHQWPDPNVYVNKEGQKLAGFEIRNLNRSYPGDKRGYLTEKLAYGIMELIRKEKPQISFDLHESSPEYPVTNAIVAHEKSMELATMAKLNLDLLDIDMKLESSPANLRGISHREWGERTTTNPILLETPNPSQGRLRGETTADLIVEGKDKYYLSAANKGLLFTDYTEKGLPLELRVAQHLQTVEEILSVFSSSNPEKAVSFKKIPDLSKLNEKGLGPFLTGIN
ncbi:succinylglutamate desuccinylase/aspartoacylase family protein [Candidatus Bipolaricaulota bacterium]|nr:succinylglutamate desuccinylase/aspartoacylase family protein [Candidatus Bipolaricaulota bacterium]MBS3792584.1 succinylglutamate desuccinylase/aspartoacylase family protein [Candidatus Bipolaricaulota bacterium]